MILIGAHDPSISHRGRRTRVDTTSLLVVSVPDTVALPVKLGDAIGAKSVLMLVLLIVNCPALTRAA